MFSVRKPTQRMIVALPMRFGSGHHYHREEFVSKAENIKYQVPVEKGDKQEQFGNENSIVENRILAKIASVFKPHRDDNMDNMRTNKYSAYYWFPRIAFFRNRWFLKAMANIFDRNRTRMSSVYDEPVQIHENSVFLYKSQQASWFMGFRVYDYFALGCLTFGMLHPYPLMWAPIIPYLAELPKMLNQMKYFTLRADLLPHTEQVVFTKTSFFAEPKYSVVDIKNLKKITPDVVPGGQYLLRTNAVDKNFIWQDNETQEIFVFDKKGIWSEEGIDHPLIN